MSFDWLSWSNPVTVWWGFLVIVSGMNIVFWLRTYRFLRAWALGQQEGPFRVDLLVLLSAAYVFGCAFRAILPRADVQRICLFDTWLSSVAVGRSVATVAELCFAVQWAIVVYALAHAAQSRSARAVAAAIVPLILVAEACSWYAVITTDYLGNVLENSLWTVTFLLIAAALVLLLDKFSGWIRLAVRLALLGTIGYAAFMLVVDVPMYVGRWQADLASGKELLGFFAGLHDAATRWVVTRDIARWDGEIAWLSLYFSVAVWTSLALCGFVLVRDDLPRYGATPARSTAARRRLSPRTGTAER